MPLKTFEGPSVGGLLAQIRTELGPEAVIVDVSHRVRGVSLTAADAETARAMKRERRPRPTERSGHDVANAQGPTTLDGGRSTLDVGRSTPAQHAASRNEAPQEEVTRPRVARERPVPQPLMLAFIGPTGAGKTTTVAKLAAHPRLFGRANIGLLNLDTYRVGAAEQIAQLAALSDVPIASAHGLPDLGEARQALRECEIVLVDCPGRGPQLHRDRKVVADMLDALKPAERHLVISAGTHPTLVRRTIERYAGHRVTHLLATKVDEMPDDWAIFDAAAELGLPMRWLADGQMIPQDLRSAAARLAAARCGHENRARSLAEGAA